MLDSALSSVFGTADSLVASVSTVQFLMCCAASIVLGAAVACIYMFRHKYSKNFVVTLALLPLIVQMVITLVNGNLGAGIAVMGVFNLVRFRSIPGSAKDIGSVFLAMAIGLATGMGFIALAVLFTVIVGVVNVVYVLSPFGRPQQPEKVLRMTVPEDLEFDGMFDAVLARYTAEHELMNPATAWLPESDGNMLHLGSFASFVGGLEAAAGAAEGERKSAVVVTASVLISCVLGVLLTLTGGLATLPLPALVLYQAAWCVLAMIFPLFQRY